MEEAPQQVESMIQWVDDHTHNLDPRGCGVFKSRLFIGGAERRGVLVRCDKQALFWKWDWSFTPLTRLMVLLWLHCVNGACRSEAQQLMVNVGHHCGAADHRHFHYTPLCLLQWLSFIPSLKQQCWIPRYRAPLSLAYFSLGQYQSPTLAVASRHFLHKDCFWWNCKKSCFSLEERKASLQLNWRELRECPDGRVCVNVERWKCWRNAKRAMNSSDGWFSLWVKPE